MLKAALAFSLLITLKELPISMDRVPLNPHKTFFTGSYKLVRAEQNVNAFSGGILESRPKVVWKNGFYGGFQAGRQIILAKASIQDFEAFRQGRRSSASPPEARNRDRPRIPISSSVSRQSATKEGVATASLRAPRRANETNSSSV